MSSRDGSRIDGQGVSTTVSCATARCKRTAVIALHVIVVCNVRKRSYGRHTLPSVLCAVVSDRRYERHKLQTGAQQAQGILGSMADTQSLGVATDVSSRSDLPDIVSTFSCGRGQYSFCSGKGQTAESNDGRVPSLLMLRCDERCLKARGLNAKTGRRNPRWALKWSAVRTL